jgi:hypothetical protein
MTLHLTRSSRLWKFQLLGFEVFQVRLQRRDFRPLEDKNPSFVIFIKQTQLSLILFQ